MFKIGDVILYGAQGICEISHIESKQIGKTISDYYVLKPLFNENTAVFVPVENEFLTAKMQSVLTKQDADELIKKAPKIEFFETKDENEKREQYKAVLSSGDREKLISVIKTIKAEQSVRRQSGKKLNMIDEQTLRKAELLLYNELAYVLDVTPDEAQNIIKF